MKSIIFITVFTVGLSIASGSATAQVGIGTTAPDASSVLDVTGTLKGLLIPRMTQADRDLITNPATGLVIFQNDNTPGLYYNSGTPASPVWGLVGKNAGQWLTSGTSIYYNTGNVGIGTSNPVGRLEVSGGDAFINSITVGRGGGNFANNAAFGSQALAYNSSGQGNTALGPNALRYGSSGNQNVAIGYYALNYNYTGGNNVAIGASSLYSSESGAANIAIGTQSLYSNKNGGSNSAIGFNSMFYNIGGLFNVAMGHSALCRNVAGSRATAIGSYAMENANNTSSAFTNFNVALGCEALRGSSTPAANTGNNNTALGYQSLTGNTAGADNLAAGLQSLCSNTTGSSNVALGNQAGFSNSAGSGNVFLGYHAGYNETGSNKLYIATSSANPPLVYGDFLTGRVGLGTISPSQKLSVSGSARITDSVFLNRVIEGISDSALVREGNVVKYRSLAGAVTSAAWSLSGNSGTLEGTNYIGTSDNVPLNFRVNGQNAGRIDASSTVFLGYQAGNSNTASGNTGIGYLALTNTSYSGSLDNTALGYKALQNNNGNGRNTSVGAFALSNLTTGEWSVAVGAGALMETINGTHNTAVGGGALTANIDGGGNTAVGAGSSGASTGGIHNSALGMYSMYWRSDGNHNVAIGYQSGYNVGSGSYNVFLGNRAGYSETGSNKLYIANSEVDPPLIYGDFAAGVVGIGTTSPARPLHVSDVMRLEPRSSAPANPEQGDIYFDSTINKLRVYDGTAWQECW